MAGLREIGSAFIRLWVKKDGLSTGLKEAEREVKQSADNMNATAGGMFSSLKEVRKNINDTIGMVVSLALKVTGLITIFVSLGAAARGFYDWVFKSAEAFKQAEQGSLGLLQNLEQLSRLEKAAGDPTGIGLESQNAAVGAVKARYQAVAKAAAEEEAKLDAALRKQQWNPFFSEEDEAIALEAIAEQRRIIEISAEDAQKAILRVQTEFAKKRADAAAKATVEAASDAYDEANDPLLKHAEAFRKSQSDAVDYVIERYRAMSAEATREWGQQIQAELAAAAEAFNRLQAQQRNQSASADIKVMVGLLKQLVDGQR